MKAKAVGTHKSKNKIKVDDVSVRFPAEPIFKNKYMFKNIFFKIELGLLKMFETNINPSKLPKEK